MTQINEDKMRIQFAQDIHDVYNKEGRDTIARVAIDEINASGDALENIYAHMFKIQDEQFALSTYYDKKGKINITINTMPLATYQRHITEKKYNKDLQHLGLHEGTTGIHKKSKKINKSKNRIKRFEDNQ